MMNIAATALAIVATASAYSPESVTPSWCDHAKSIFSQNKGYFNTIIYSKEKSIWERLWKICSPDGDAEILASYLPTCTPVVYPLFYEGGDGQNFNCLGSMWHLIDIDMSGGVDFDEFATYVSRLAVIDARATMIAYDSDKNGILDVNEQTGWKHYIYHHHTSEGALEGAWGDAGRDAWGNAWGAAWSMAQVYGDESANGDARAASKIAIASFYVGLADLL